MEDYNDKKDRFLAGDLMDKEARLEFEACTGVALDDIVDCRNDESGCTVVTIGEITEECGNCVSERNSDYEKLFTLEDDYLALNVELEE